MKKWPLQAAAALLAALLILPMAAPAEVLFEEGYVRVQGEVTVYADTALTDVMGVIQDASVVYVTEASEDEGYYTIAFGVNWVVRIGYIRDDSVMPMTGIEQEAYLTMARDALTIRDIYLLNVGFDLHEEDLSPNQETPLPTMAPTPLPTVAPFTVSASGNGIHVIMQPVDQSGFNGEMVVLAVGAENVKEYQWQYLKDGEWVDSVMSQATSAAMKLVVFPSAQRMYRCKMTGTYGDVVYSDTVAITEE